MIFYNCWTKKRFQLKICFEQWQKTWNSKSQLWICLKAFSLPFQKMTFFFHFATTFCHDFPYVTCRSAEGLSQVCHRSVQSYSRPIWRKTEVCKSAYCLWQTSHENDCFFDCVLPFILFAASLLQTFRDFWWLCK